MKIDRIALTEVAVSATKKQILIEALDASGNLVPVQFLARIKVTDAAGSPTPYSGTAAHATVTTVSGSSTVAWTHTSTKDITFQSVGSEGSMLVEVNNATAEAVTAYQGDPPLGGKGADVSQTLEMVFG